MTEHEHKLEDHGDAAAEALVLLSEPVPPAQ